MEKILKEFDRVVVLSFDKDKRLQRRSLAQDMPSNRKLLRNNPSSINSEYKIQVPTIPIAVYGAQAR